jgi:medium-chain acyl-[acyl-carrier-protein] hydrolase
MTETKTPLILVVPFQITSADTDMEARLRPGALLNLLIQGAIQSADQLGFGFGNLRKEQLFWVLSRMHIEILRPLKWHESGRVETWPKDVDGLQYIRDFKLFDCNNELVALATSVWLAIDFQTKKPRKYEGMDADLLDSLRLSHAIEDRPEKLPSINEGVENIISPGYFDFDLNRHVTSTRYVDWMMDQLPASFVSQFYPNKLTINYMKETRPGETVKLKTYLHENQAIFEGLHLSNSQTSFRGKIEFH